MFYKENYKAFCLFTTEITSLITYLEGFEIDFLNKIALHCVLQGLVNDLVNKQEHFFK